MQNVKILIATPLTGGSVRALYSVTLFKTLKRIHDCGGQADLITFDGSCIVSARNYFAAKLLRDNSYTHLFMIDSDMSFDGDIIEKLVSKDKHFVAGIYPQRRIDLNRFAVEAADRLTIPRSPPNLPRLMAVSMEYNVIPTHEQSVVEYDTEDGLISVESIGLGCALIKRELFDEMIRKKAVTMRRDRLLQSLGFGEMFYGFFDEMKLPDGDYKSEDFSFCQRWRNVPDAKIWGLLNDPVGHVGMMVYEAAYSYSNARERERK